jgi:hypothetical protein
MAMHITTLTPSHNVLVAYSGLIDMFNINDVTSLVKSVLFQLEEAEDALGKVERIHGTIAKVWKNKNGKIHRDGDKPAIICINGDKKWFQNGKLHREGGLPAIEYANGNREWYIRGLLNRPGGCCALVALPTVEYSNGSKEWHKDGRLHREGDLPAIDYVGIGSRQEWWIDDKLHRDDDKPAIVYSHGLKRWYIHGERYYPSN